MNVLVACEESQEVCKAFRARGHNAYSCDLQRCSGGHPEWHIQTDALSVMKCRSIIGEYMTMGVGFYTCDGIRSEVNRWDLIIVHPPCTDLAASGARWFPQKRKDGRQRKAVEFFGQCMNAYKYGWCRNIVIENPVGIISGEYVETWYPDLCRLYGLPVKPTQIVQPWMFGHGETKATCLWIAGPDVGPLEPTDIVEGREHRIWKMPPSKDRAKLRSKTYTGIARAMAEQWG